MHYKLTVKSVLLQVFILTSTVFVSGCGDVSRTEEDVSFKKIMDYADDGNKPVPTLQDYADVGVTGITGVSNETLDALNVLVEARVAEDVDTAAELFALLLETYTNNDDNLSLTLDEDTPKSITLSSSVTQSGYIFTQTVAPTHGTITVLGDSALYTPYLNFNGADTFTYEVNDGTNDLFYKSVEVTVRPINDAPTVNAGVDFSVIEKLTGTLQGAGADIDTNDSLSYSWSPANNLSNANIAQPVFTAPEITNAASIDDGVSVSGSETPNVIHLYSYTFTLTVTDSDGLTATDTVTIGTTDVADQPLNPVSIPANGQVTLSWDAVDNATSYDICLAEETISSISNCSLFQGGTLKENQTSPVIITGLTNGTLYYFRVIPKNNNGTGVVSAEVNAKPLNVVSANTTGKLNDTGITYCVNSGDPGYKVDCDSLGGTHYSVPRGQDAVSGRDVTENNPENGKVGFDFTKVDGAGVALLNQSQSYEIEQWSCVKDNVTGLIWQARAHSGTLSWYNTGSVPNSDAIGFQQSTDRSDRSGSNNTCDNYDANDPKTYCNTQAYVERVNTSMLCGASDWRIATMREIISIGNLSDGGGNLFDEGYFLSIERDGYYIGSDTVETHTLHDVENKWRVRFSAINLQNNDEGRSIYDSSNGERTKVFLVRDGQ